MHSDGWVVQVHPLIQFEAHRPPDIYNIIYVILNKSMRTYIHGHELGDGRLEHVGELGEELALGLGEL